MAILSLHCAVLIFITALFGTTIFAETLALIEKSR